MYKTIITLAFAIILQIPLHQSDRHNPIPDGGLAIHTKSSKPAKHLPSVELISQTQLQSIQVATTTTQNQNTMSHNINYGGSHQDWMAAAGISADDYQYVDYIVSHESGWRVDAYNPSGAYGLCQSLPGSKMAISGSDWQTNPVTQLKWCSSYAGAKGGWYASYLFWINHNWW